MYARVIGPLPPGVRLVVTREQARILRLDVPQVAPADRVRWWQFWRYL